MIVPFKAIMIEQNCFVCPTDGLCQMSAMRVKAEIASPPNVSVANSDRGRPLEIHLSPSAG
jgi:hypothetical protein